MILSKKSKAEDWFQNTLQSYSNPNNVVLKRDTMTKGTNRKLRNKPTNLQLIDF